ncbi:MAG: DegT/DnrJ/EryC1/StrS family aminotransferase [Candidatus Paceibacterota bacterium]|jgi:dTDP-4-amino-4,6-dideoxygalactose transaminase
MSKKVQQKYIVFGSPMIEEPEIKEVVKTLRSGWLGTGPKVTKFEKMMSELTGAKYAMAVNSCTAALHLSLVASGIGKGDEVITTPLTFCATANAIIHSGATPVFVDVDLKTMNIDETKIEKAITKKTKAIMPVHFAGRPCNMDKILTIAKKYRLLIIEDAAHAIGAEYKNKKIGSMGDLTCISFYVTKNITTGEGGMVLTNNKEFADKIKVLALHGMSKDAWKRFSDDGYKHYEVVYPGFKYNMMDIQASIGIHQLKRIEKYHKKRKQIWDFYNKELKGLPIILPDYKDKDIKHVMHLYTILVDEKKCGISRDKFMQELHLRGIGTGVHYNPVHLHDHYTNTYGHKVGHYPNAEYIGSRTVSLPLSAKLTIAEAKRIVDAIKGIL